MEKCVYAPPTPAECPVTMAAAERKANAVEFLNARLLSASACPKNCLSLAAVVSRRRIRDRLFGIF